MKYSILALAFSFAWNICQASDARYTVHGCKDGHIRLNCRTGTILVTDVILADSSCYGSGCCPRSNDCRGAPSDSYRNIVFSTCNGRGSCVVGVEIRNIGCSVFAPRNDYANITYICQEVTSSTPPSTSRLTAFVERVISPFAVANQQTTQPSSTQATPTQAPPHFDASTLLEDGVVISQTIIREENTIDEFTTAWEKVQPDHSKLDVQTPKVPETNGKVDENRKDSESAAQVHSKQDGYGHLDPVTRLVAIVVGGLVLIAAIISAAIVIAIKKRRVPLMVEDYDLPSTPCTNDDSIRNSNLYDFIPDIRDMAICAPVCTTAGAMSGGAEDNIKENEYLKPVIDNEDAPYAWIP